MYYHIALVWITHHIALAASIPSVKRGQYLLVFKSGDITTKHIQNALSNTLVAGTILPNKTNYQV